MSAESISYLSQLVGVFGHPVAENPTIVMQEAAFRACGLNWRYLNIEVRPEQLADAVTGLRAFNMAGINLTIPHKVAVISHLDELSPEAEVMGAVNTVVRDGNRLIGHNTDGKGFVASVRQDAGLGPAGQRVVFLGAGGAARAMGVEMAMAGASHITIVNRSASRGQELVRLLNERTPAKAVFVPWEDDFVIPAEATILVNATSIGLFPDVEARPKVNLRSLRPDLLVCDVIPNPPRTAFLKAAEAAGARTLDGLGMLVGQGAIAFEMWTGVPAPVQVMREALAAVFGAAS